MTEKDLVSPKDWQMMVEICKRLYIQGKAQKRIANLQDQIRAKQAEQRNLRTTWMVYDRAKLNQLNEDIANLEKEIESLRSEMAEEK